MQFRYTKVVCTIGPAVDSAEGIRGLIEAGMDVARLNFSHGTHEEHARLLEVIRAASRECDKPIAILQDLCGPKIRTGAGGPETVETGGTVDLVPGEEASGGAIAIGYESLTRDLSVGDRILLGDGEIELRVQSVRDDALECRVEHGGAIRTRMGANLPSSALRLRAITEQDRKDLEFGLELGVDYVALSFVRSVEDVLELRGLCEAAGHPTPIVAKIETPSAVENIEQIAEAADAVMVARGDLGVELPPEAVPTVQKRVIEACRAKQRPVIVATEMLQSMVTAARPTRAEANDVANAVFEDADAVMLSAETAMGDHPQLACAMMVRIILDAESSPYKVLSPSGRGDSIPEAVAHGACQIARDMTARGMVTFTMSGTTARLVSQARPSVPMLGCSPSERTLCRMALYWGVRPRGFEGVGDIETLATRTCEYLKQHTIAETGDRFVMVFGSPLGESGATNSIRVERVR
jgi:pyruvate kinase